jgi:hypothetical protein
MDGLDERQDAAGAVERDWGFRREFAAAGEHDEFRERLDHFLVVWECQHHVFDVVYRLHIGNGDVCGAGSGETTAVTA